MRHFVPTSEGFVEAVAAGLGRVMVPEAQAEPLLGAGRLVGIAPERLVDVPLYWQPWKLDSPTGRGGRCGDGDRHEGAARPGCFVVTATGPLRRRGSSS
jgi:hypothetical protein